MNEEKKDKVKADWSSLLGFVSSMLASIGLIFSSWL